ncbi:pre-rRNA-processing protein esf1 [Elasticomyces elasticus]|nr:pre-rRNA-processing protein esf1 [Elasticomyces elasticus]KAK3621100.1 pre-rRNA-processing protein esf1 [Elasticomyces elasticus]KAK4913992.1 pre-rRNA-processing protein esf1 [Elasticomyces elasticus]KAK5739360.1 pre-rRNA-processing protein esf1 [Elasticomyces elasticus]
MADQRFSALSRDPRYRLPSKKDKRTSVDPRFGELFTDQEFRKKASVDRYGRKIKSEQGTKDLERLYKLDKDDAPGKKKKAKPEVVGSSEESAGSEDEVEVEDEEVAGKRDPARDGFSESSSEEDSSEEEESDVEAELADETAGGEQTEDIPEGEVTHRLAAVNLDWDNIRATDIMAVAASFVSSGGRIERVTIYPSEFGRERLEREELEGPPREIFASSKRQAEAEEMDEEESDEEEDEEDEEVSEDEDADEKIKQQLLKGQADDGQEFDTTALRQYQLERLRYYYAIIECGSKSAAKAIYDSMDGREYLSTANFFDLRFVPDDTEFDEAPKDECTRLPEGYKPNDFRTEALTHSKVRLTWDDDDTTRKEVQKRAFSRGEIEDNDMQAYIGSDESDADSISSRKSAAEDRKARKKAEQRQLMREKLGLGSEPAAKSKSKKEEPVGDMQVTFTSGLSKAKDGKDGIFENEPQDAESTRERYIRKERDRKQMRKDRRKASRPDAETGDAESGADAVVEEVAAAEDAGFDDPFFNDPASAAIVEKKAKKAERQKKREAQAAKDEEDASRRKELELLMAEDQADNVRHFDMREVEKAEKEAKRKGKKGKKSKKAAASEEVADAGPSFNVDSQDPRFKALFESHEYAIDPTNPRFKGTESMKVLLEEGRKKRKRGGDEDDEVEDKPVKVKSKKSRGEVEPGNDNELKGLVARLKGTGKAR